jgi:hypothetical protein
LQRSLVPEVERRIIGRETSDRSTKLAGLFVKSKPYGMFPPSSPTRSGSLSRAARGTAASREGVGMHLRFRATPVTAVVVARITSTPTVPVSCEAFGKAVDYDCSCHCFAHLRLKLRATVGDANSVYRRHRNEVPSDIFLRAEPPPTVCLQGELQARNGREEQTAQVSLAPRT